MECDVYAIARHAEGEVWTLGLNGQTLASGLDHGCAERAAATAARMSERRGREAVVLRAGARPVPAAVIAAATEIARYSLLCQHARAEALGEPQRSPPEGA